jgi:integrase
MHQPDRNERDDRKDRAHARGLFERPKGSGIWWVRYHDEHGREHREKVGPKGLAGKVYQKRKNEIQERRFFPERIGRREVLVSEMIDEYLKRIEGQLRSYRECKRAGAYWKQALRGKTLRQVLPGDVERYMASRTGKLAPATINRHLAFLKRVFNVAIKDGRAERNPVREVRFYKENNERVRFLSADEEERLRKAVREDNWPMVVVATHTGLRRGEQFRLRWDEIDFSTGIITIPRSKSGLARRLPMNDTVRDVLRALPSRLKSEWVFPSATGTTPLDGRNYVVRTFVPALKKASIEGFRWHDLRHTFASRLVMAGVDLRAVQELMGHKTMTMTLRYSHLSPEHMVSAVQRLNRPATGTTTGTSNVEPESASLGS